MLFKWLTLLYVVPSWVYGGWYTPHTYPPYDPEEARMVRCQNYNLTKLGCHNERDPNKPQLPLAIPEMLYTTDSSSGKYVGYERSTFPTYTDFLARFICDCAEKTRTKGYTHFSISNYFECWSGKNVAKTYNLYKGADGCVRDDKRQCDLHNLGYCAGAGGLHFVYALKSPYPTPTTAVTPSSSTQSTTSLAPSTRISVKCGSGVYNLRKLGCYNENENSRAFPELVLTAVDHYNQRYYAGYALDTKNYDTFLPKFVCDCAAKVSSKGFSIFGVRSYGACYSGPNVACTYYKYGQASDCINQKRWKCSNSSSMLCASPNAKSIYAFVLSDSKDGTKCSTSTPTTPQVTTTATPSPKTTPYVGPSPTAPMGKPSITCGKVRYNLMKLGCWRELGDVRPPRAMPELILTGRDKTSKVFAGYEFTRHSYAAFLERFLCDCVSKIKQKGYSVFGLQFYAECWSGPQVDCTYQKFGGSSRCVNQNMKKCSDSSTMMCSGETSRSVYVYVPEDTPVTCPIPTQPQTTPQIITTPKTTPKQLIKPKSTPKIVTTPKTTPKILTTTQTTTPIPKGPPVVKCGNVEYKLTKLGCWNELGDFRPPRAMPELLLTSRDQRSKVYVGYNFDIHNYAAFLKRFMCDCVRKVKQKGYSVFGLQFYGECWSGPRVACTYKKFGAATRCVNENHARCSDDSKMLCSGNTARRTYVYVPVGTPITCPKTTPTPRTTQKVTPKTTPKIFTTPKTTLKISTTPKTTPRIVTTPPTTTPKIPTAPKTTPIPKGPARIKCGNVEYKLIKLGCWKEFGHLRPPRVLPELLLTANDKKSKVYAGYEFHNQKYQDFIRRFTCDCVYKVIQKGYSVFGLQFYGECYSGPRAACDYKTFGKSYNCINENFGKCLDKSSRLCSGQNAEDIYVYIPADTPGGLTCPTTIPSTTKITTPSPKITTPSPKITTPTTEITTTTDSTTTPARPGPPIIKCGNVEYKLTKLGCWKDLGDLTPPKAMPELLLTARDLWSSVYVGYEFHKMNYDVFIKKFTCDCVKKVKRKGYSVFGLQFYGECWSGPRVGCTYKKFGKSNECVNENQKKCSDSTNRLCSGHSSQEAYVYVPVYPAPYDLCPTTMPTSMTTVTTPAPTGPPVIKCGNVEYKLTKLGCWKDLGDLTPPKAMPELLLTARDIWSSVYVGYEYHKMNYDVFIKKFTCDCVKKVKRKGYSVFGLQFYGECWSGPRVGCTYKKFGKSNECVNENQKKCSDSTNRLCSGHSSQEAYVYVPIYPAPYDLCPTTMPTTMPTSMTTTPAPTGPPVIKCGNVEYKLTKLGCWKDLGDLNQPKAMPELLLTARDIWSSVYVGYEFHKMNYDVFIKKFTCDCVKKVKRKGYSVFGLQFYGECWSGPRVGCTYRKFGKSNKCVNENQKSCSDSTNRLCSGHSSQEAYVYIPTYPAPQDLCPKTATPTSMITTTTPLGPPVVKCKGVEYKLTKLGCWKELGDTMPPRAIPELLLTARDKKSSVYVGYDAQKLDHGDFIRRFTCNCVEKVKQKGYTVFGVQFYGECWAGPKAACTYQRFGQSNSCVNEEMTQCLDQTSRICSGHSSQEIYVYVPADTSSTCPTTLPDSTTTPSISTPTPSVGPPSVTCDSIEYKLTKLGCWTERINDRAIPQLMLTARDRQSKLYAGYPIDTSNYATFLDRFICDCIERVDSFGYSIFGLRFYGECWSGPETECTYEKYGQSDSCVNERMSACSDRSPMKCTGDSPMNAYVYARADRALPTCPPTSTVTTPSTPTVPTTATTRTPTTPITTPSSPDSPTPTMTITSPTPTPTSPVNIPPGFECKKALDIVIAVDASGSVMDIPYTRIKNLVRSLTLRFTSVEPTYFGLLNYNYRVVTIATLQEQISNSMTLRNRIRDMRYLGQATLTQTALTSAQALFDNGARNDSNVQKILIVFTDGRTYGGKQTLREPLKKLRDSGVRIKAVAVGRESYLDTYSLLVIAENQSNLLIIPALENPGEVEKYVDQVAFMVCPK